MWLSLRGPWVDAESLVTPRFFAGAALSAIWPQSHRNFRPNLSSWARFKVDEASMLMLAHLIRMPDETHLEVVRLLLGKPESDATEICKSFLPALGSQ